MRYLLTLLSAMLISCHALAAPPAAEQQARALSRILHQADDAYYNHCESLMSDAAYDELKQQYNALITQYPELAEAPAVGAAPDEPGIAHAHPVLSLQKAITDEDVSNFLSKCGTTNLFCISPKIDGLTIVLHYRDGLLTRALTRGDGKTGIDITAAILATRAVPASLKNAPPQLDVRGEAYLPRPAFDALNRRRVAVGDPPLKSQRNTAAGTLRLHDYAEIARRGLQIQIFDLLDTDTPPTTHTKALALLESLGLPIIGNQTVPAENVLAAIEQINQQRAQSPIPTDGVVIRLDNRATFEQLGRTAHHPRGALARKYKQPPAETRLLAVEWSRAESGTLTPVAIFEPVDIGGATIRRATLHNEAHLRAMDLKIGDTILVIRAGGTTPELIGNRPELRDGTETDIPTPPENSLPDARPLKNNLNPF